jgi:redox-sensitive bicupin YhaK (pirin superfamily)
MSTPLSPVITAHSQVSSTPTGTFHVKSLDLGALGQRASPLFVVDDFRVRGRPFPPHPHAGFSAVSYVFDDSAGGLRSRDSLGNDAVVGRGGVVWTQAGSGVIHHEIPAEPDRELHGLQLFVNASSGRKLAAPHVHRLQSGEAPEWLGEGGDRVRIVAGVFECLSSPLVPDEPFLFLDVELRRVVAFEVPNGHNTLVYVVDGGRVLALTNGHQQPLEPGQAISVRGGGTPLRLEASQTTHLVILGGAEIREPLVSEGPFMMNTEAQIDAARERYRTGAMGWLGPIT